MLITGQNWPEAIPLAGEPSPSVAGTTESFTFTFGVIGTNFFAIKTVDDAGNWSLLSNVVSITIDCPCDTTNDKRIDLNCDKSLDISDLVTMVNFMFGGHR